MRGALERIHVKGPWPGIIPADAGSTWWAAGSAPVYQDHPRGCGEHPGCKKTAQNDLGSSPRMRGALSDFDKEISRARIIPADAGSTITKIDWSKYDEDHPRGCEEHTPVLRNM